MNTEARPTSTGEAVSNQEENSRGQVSSEKALLEIDVYEHVTNDLGR